MGNTKLLVIGLDSGDPFLIRQWADEGHLPTFGGLFGKAAYGQVANPRGLEAGSAWPTFYYGVSPATHGQYDGTRYFDPATYQDGKYAENSLYSHPIWKVLSDAGKRVAVVDAPYRYLSEGLNGIDIHDWGTHAPTGKNSIAKFKTAPAALAQEIERRFGLDPLKGMMCDAIRPRSLSEQRRFRNMLLERVRQKLLMSDHFLSSGDDWALFLTVFSECHCIGHHAWHIHDPSHPEHDPAIAREIGDPVLDIYKAVDTGVGELLQAAGEETTVIVYCSHGMDSRGTATKLLDKILARLDGHRPNEVSDPVTRALRTTWRSLPTGLRNGLKPAQAMLHKKIYRDGFQGARADRRFFEVLANDRTAGVRINLVGREAQGKVTPGTEYKFVCRTLEEQLLRVVDADTGVPLVKQVHHTADIYFGKRRNNLPDLLVEWNPEAGCPTRIESPDIGEIRHENLGYRTGDHRPEGLFFAVGPAIEASGDVGPVSVMDFAPSIAAFFGLTLPRTDGAPIHAIAGRAEPEAELRSGMGGPHS